MNQPPIHIGSYRGRLCGSKVVVSPKEFDQRAHPVQIGKVLDQMSFSFGRFPESLWNSVRALFVGLILFPKVLGAGATIASSGQPNLAPQNVVLGSYAVLPGDVVTVEWTTANSGSGFAFASFSAVRLGTSPVVPPQGTFDDLTFTTPEIAGNSSVRQAVSVSIPAKIPLGTYYVWVVADVYGVTAESTTVDNFAHSPGFVVQNVRGQPNLRPLNIALGAGTVQPGQPLTVMWTMTNAGSVTCPPSYTGLRLGNSRLVVPPAADGLSGVISTPQIAANSSVRFTNVVMIPPGTPFGNYYLWVVADDVANSTLNQSSRLDDAQSSGVFTVAPAPAQPNLVTLNVTLSSYSARPGDQVVVMWTLTNSGSGNCPASITGLHLGGSPLEPPRSDALGLQIVTPAVAAGASVRITNVVTIPPEAGFGLYYLWVVADETGALNQTSRLDDVARSSAFTVAPVVSRPNLVPLNVSLNTYSVRPGSLLTVMWTMANVGDGNCAASLTGLRLGTSALEMPPFDTIQLTTPEIAAHSTIRQTNVVTIPAETPTGTYYIWVVADDVALSTIDQSVRDDDAARSGVFGVVDVVGKPNLVPQNVALSTDFARPGDQVTVRWTMRNLGSVTCPRSVTGYGFGQSSTSVPTNGVILTVETPEIVPGGPVDQTNVVTIPTTASLGTYYLWVVADDVVTSSLNQSSRDDDAARSGPLVVVSELPRPNLAPLNVTLSALSARPGEQITVTWAMTNSGNANCAASVTGLHLGTSAIASPTNDTLNVKIATPAIDARSSVFQTNVITIPADTVAGSYYVWVVADDVVNSNLNQSSKADDTARSSLLDIVTETPRPNLVPSNVGLSIGAARPGGQITVTWTMANVGAGDCPPSTTGLHLGNSPSVPPAGDSLNAKIATPAINALSARRQTNVVTIPAITLPGTYYLWVVADDVANSTLNQTSKLDDAVSSGPIVVAVIALTTPGAGAVVDPAPSFGWIAADIPNASVYLANKAAPVFGTDAVVVFDSSIPTNKLALTMTNWVNVVNTLGVAESYYWTIGNVDAGQRQAYAEWRAFKTRPVASGGRILTNGGFQFELLAPNQPEVLVQGSETLTSWVDVETVRNTNGTVIFTDPGASDQARRLYRAK